jgi:hypothetical protein
VVSNCPALLVADHPAQPMAAKLAAEYELFVDCVRAKAGF